MNLSTEASMKIRFLITSLVLAVLVLAMAPGIEGSVSNAPAFELYPIAGGEKIVSDELFSSHHSTFIVFWESQCPHCVESLAGCQGFFDEYGGEDIAVVGINCDGEDFTAARGIVESGGITFPQLRDRGAVVARRYGVPLSVFAVFLIDENGYIEASAFDPPGSVKEKMVEMLTGGREEAQYEPASGEEARAFIFAGSARLRFLSVDARGDAASGPYGEPLESRNSLLHRFELEASFDISRNLTVGGLLRLSNEGLDVLRGGPDYFDSEYGSAFAAIRYGKLDLRIGYYAISLTPLTLMRWDWEDNPRTGGEAGCNCGNAAGVLIVESLEELGPDLRFEGARLDYTGENHSVTAFYAMPRRARATTPAEEISGKEPACYSLEIYGANASWNRYVERTGSFIRAGAALVGSWENPRSIDVAELGYAPFERYRTLTFSLTGEIPVFRHVGLRGEWMALNDSKGYNLGAGHDEQVELSGTGGIAGVKVEKDGAFLLFVDYLFLDDEFYSPFAAISYEGDREGIRASSEVSLPGDWSAVSLFYKRMREYSDPAGGEEREQDSLYGATFDVDFASGFGASIGYMDKRDWRDGVIEDYEAARKALSLSGRYRFGKNSYVQAQYQHVKNTDDTAGDELESTADLYSVYIGASF